jgi:separase
MALAYLHASCPALVANLWDVTDGEIDRFCTALLEHTTREGGSLLSAVARARSACRLRFLTGAAAVAYGVPLAFQPRDAPQRGP